MQYSRPKACEGLSSDADQAFVTPCCRSLRAELVPPLLTGQLEAELQSAEHRSTCLQEVPGAGEGAPRVITWERVRKVGRSALASGGVSVYTQTEVGLRGG